VRLCRCPVLRSSDLLGRDIDDCPVLRSQHSRTVHLKVRSSIQARAMTFTFMLKYLDRSLGDMHSYAYFLGKLTD
jgi:hypothetical protein